METSYTVDFEAEQVRGLIRELTQTDEYGRAGDTPPFPVRCAFSRWNSVHAALVFSSPQPESFGRGWVLWSSGLAGHAALGGRAMPSSSQVVSAK